MNNTHHHMVMVTLLLCTIGLMSCQPQSTDSEDTVLSKHSTPDGATENKAITSIDLQNFKTIDLSSWTKLASKDESGGDAEINTTRYENDGIFLEMENAEVGEYGYSNQQKILDAEGNVLKERRFEFVVDDEMYIQETIKDYTTSPTKTCYRKKKMEKHFMQMDERPIEVGGTCQDAPTKTISLNFEIMDNSCGNVDKEDTGCTCSFRASKDDYSTSVISSAFDGNACMQFSGMGIIEMKGGLTNNGRALWTKRSQMEHWITLNEKGEDTIFDDPMNIADNYEQHLSELVSALLVMDEMPDEIPYQTNGTVGMGHRSNVRDLCTDAIQAAKQAKSKGDSGPQTELLYQNEAYEVILNCTVIGKTDSFSDKYECKAIIKDKKTGKELGSQVVWGSCQC